MGLVLSALIPANCDPLLPCRGSLAGRARHYRQPGWDSKHMAQALADASAEAIANMSLERLRQAVQGTDVAAELSLTNPSSESAGTAAESQARSPKQLRAVLSQRARECRTRIFGGTGLGSLDVSHALPDDTPDTDDEGGTKARRRTSNRNASGRTGY